LWSEEGYMVYEIEKIVAREILDSRGNPTVEADVCIRGGCLGRGAVPSGASTGVHEALELRDGDSSRYGGKGVLNAVENINEAIAKAVVGLDCSNQELIDKTMLSLDGTENKGRLGANAILAVSIAAAKAASHALGISLYRYLGGIKKRKLPVPMMNVINGGKHAGNELNIQEFMILPIRAKSFKEALRMGVETYQQLKGILRKKYGASAVNVGDEGGYAPPMKTTSEALEALGKAVEAAGYKAGRDIFLGIDSASSSFYDMGSKKYKIDGRALAREEIIDYYKDMCTKYGVLSIEDPLYEDDFEGFAEATSKLSGVQIVGDDLFVTNVNRLAKGISIGAANALLLKVNQIGTLSEAMAAANLAFEHGYRVVVSHRSGETEDPTIADISVGLGAQMIKTGAPARGERTAKYNQLLRIEEELGLAAEYWGKDLARS
jgi:enolase